MARPRDDRIGLERGDQADLWLREHDAGYGRRRRQPAPLPAERQQQVEAEWTELVRERVLQGTFKRAVCEMCGGPVSMEKREDARTCSNRCRQSAYRQRKRAASSPDL
jgi:hypothetical protein